MNTSTLEIYENVFSSEDCLSLGGLWLAGSACYDVNNNWAPVDAYNTDECYCGEGGEIAGGMFEECMEGNWTDYFWFEGIDPTAFWVLDEDMNGACYGGTLVDDDCGICGGDNSPNTGTCDCSGDPNGTALEDCLGECGGLNLEDECGVCNEDSTDDCVADCSETEEACLDQNVEGEDPTAFWADGACYGGTLELDC